MYVYYCDHHIVSLPAGHRFPMQKYTRLREALVARGVLAPEQLEASELAPLSALRRVHEASYVDRVLLGGLDEREQRAIGFPWSPELVRRTLASVGGTLAAAQRALREGMAGNLAGGTHHAHADRGAGFCVFNDIAIAAQALLDGGVAGQVLVIDLDVHQGDGTAALFADEPRVFTCSLHGANNFPFRKAASDLDVAFPDGTGDAAYLAALERALETCFAAVRPDLIFYQGGVDGLAADRFGRLALTHDGLAQRDRLVLGEARRRGIPLVLTLGGGYADPIDASVEAYLGTYAVARELYD